MVRTNDGGGYQFNNDGLLTMHFDTQWHRTIFDYSGGLLSEVASPDGARTLALAYNEDDLLTSVTDHTGRTVEYAYDLDLNLTVVTDTLDHVWTYVYSGTHLLHEVVDPTERVVERTFYDKEGRAYYQENGLGKPVAEIDFQLGGMRVVTETGRTPWVPCASWRMRTAR